jgi:hypothetical protein
MPSGGGAGGVATWLPDGSAIAVVAIGRSLIRQISASVPANVESRKFD